MPVLVINELVKRREQAGSAFELRIPEVALEAGRFYGVVGPSGSGKSTLLDVLALVLRPTSVGRFEISTAGQVRPWRIHELWQRQDEGRLAEARKTLFGYVLQSGGLIGFLTVRQNLSVPFQLVGRTPDMRRIEEMADRFGVGRELDKKPRFLSGGQRQRVAILRALMLEPTLILADEPTAAVDQVRARQIVSEFRTLALASGCTIVMVSHDRGLIGGVADHILELATTVDQGGTAISSARWADAPGRNAA